MTVSSAQFRILKSLAAGRISSIKDLDQRPLRALFLRRMFTFNNSGYTIMQAGWDTLKEYGATGVPKRKNVNADTFIEANDRRNIA